MNEPRLTLDERREIDVIADQFEQAFKSGDEPKIESFLKPGIRRHLLKELLVLEIDLCRLAGIPLSQRDILRRFPEDDEIVSKAFSSSESDSEKDSWLTEEETSTAHIGRYQVVRVLGKGGFGIVYLAVDPQLGRQVAVKVPRRQRFGSTAKVNAFIDEARKLANLKHPLLVTVYDVQVHDGLPFIVQEFIEGTNLSQWVKTTNPTFAQISRVFADISACLGYAHRQGLTHCDLKPANILMDGADLPHVADFGLAVRDTERLFLKGEISGTPAMMAPEQVRGESHRIDGRTDIWAMGIMLYRMLTDQKPFQSKSRTALFEEIQFADPIPPMQINHRTPNELERICLKCLCKRKTDRYQVAEDLQEDLKAWLSQHGTHELSSNASYGIATRPTKEQTAVIPKGLRSFGAEDADFFLSLLPGPRDRDGLPEILRFWKHRVEETDPSKTVPVGLIYGPSGCGKSSLVKAGLLPRLDDHVVAIYLAATPTCLEERILHKLRNHVPATGDHRNLIDALADIRRHGDGRNRKVLILLDQFEQWLHANSGKDRSTLINCLRQCDGGTLQVILLARDDFYVSANQVFQEMDEQLQEGHNYTLVNRFSVEHARKILTEFGRAYHALPATLTSEQEDFLDAALHQLSEDNRVICVRLALFAEMMKSKPWVPSSLRDVGGFSGIGTYFLDQSFSSSSAPAAHRMHEKAVRNVLGALLPETDTGIKGSMKTARQIQEVSGYSDETRFKELLQILDSDMRLITPSGSEESDSAQSVENFYQLTHDFSVPFIRDWLTQKMRQTRRGRARMHLTQLADQWSANPQKRFLPSIFEYGALRILTKKQSWSRSEWAMMHTAGRKHLLSIGLAIALVLIVSFVVYESIYKSNATNLVETLARADDREVASLLNRTQDYDRYLQTALETRFEEAPEGSAERIRLNLALMLKDPRRYEYLFEQRAALTPDQALSIRYNIKDSSAYADALWKDVDQANSSLLTYGMLAGFTPNHHQWDSISESIAELLVEKVTDSPSEWAAWEELLAPIGLLLAPELFKYSIGEEKELPSNNAFSLYLNYATGASNDSKQLAAELRKSLNDEKHDSDKERLAFRQAHAAIELLSRGEANVWSVCKQSTDMRARTYFMQFAARELEADVLLGCLDRPDVLNDPFVLSAIVQTLGNCRDRYSDDDRDLLIQRISEFHKTHSDPGVHSAATWFLRTWGKQDIAAANHEELKDDSPVAGETYRRWYVNNEDHTMLFIDADKVVMGSTPESDPNRIAALEQQNTIQINRVFAIAAEEVTRDQYIRFLAEQTPFTAAENERIVLQSAQAYQVGVYPYIKTHDSAACVITWYSAALYCNWLSERANIPKDQWCYGEVAADETGDIGLELRPGFMDLQGYRLPTEAEWEYACRAGTSTSRFFGSSPDLLPLYARFRLNQRHTWPVGMLRPNQFGLFDTYGNVMEWCHDKLPSDRVAGKDISKETFAGRSTRIMRGGAYDSEPVRLRSAYRSNNLGHINDQNRGFRVARTIKSMDDSNNASDSASPD